MGMYERDAQIMAAKLAAPSGRVTPVKGRRSAPPRPCYLFPGTRTLLSAGLFAHRGAGLSADGVAELDEDGG